ncbi:MAG: aminotransferase class I/II-fold pyridoxal phosphate-dependent enzyme [Eubacterium sp.]|nr:aminotransferase class I/II-fold pyridoxal phosphate-dependent enzyme [Eubacterium sp.]MBQ2053348.1 aminotransferase class I/II-fold pyridoxal phosphate-dependent enzyme [Eubacterium sp.]
MKSVNKVVQDMKPSGIRKFFDIVSEMPDAISLGVGEPDFDTPWHVVDEGIYSLERGKTYYTSNSGLIELREEICKWYERKYNVSYNPATESIITVGGSEGIDLALRAMLNPGDEVIIPEPSYVSYVPCVSLAGGKPVIIDLKNENKFKLTEEELASHITDKTKVLILSYPNNPTGAIMTKEDLEPIAELAKKHDLYVISDEIYSELTYTEEPHFSIASLPGMQERTIVINGFSKAYAMTGWRLGYALAPKDIAKLMVKIHQFCIMCAPTTSQYAAIEALKNGDKDIANMRKSYDERRRYLLKRLSDIGMPAFEPQGAFYIFPSIQGFGMSSDEFATKLLESQKLAVVPGNAFGNSGEGFIRISYAYSIDQLREALDRIAIFTHFQE